MKISIPKIQEPIFSGDVFCIVNNERVLFDGTWHDERMFFDIPKGITYTLKAQREFKKKQIHVTPNNTEWGKPIHTTKGIAIETVQGCNMKCNHCSHFCNYNRKGFTPIETIIYTLIEWSKKLNPASLCITGGECFLHPELGKIIKYARQLYPDTLLRVFTNGTLLEKKLPEIQNILKATKSTLVVSIKNYSKIGKRDWTEQVKKGIATANVYGIPVELKNFNWLAIHAGSDSSGKPLAFHGDSEIGFNNCTTKNCARFIYQDKIWKCPPAYIAYKMKNENMLEPSEWQDMLSSEPATTNWCRNELLEFLQQKPCVCCKNCPQKKIFFSGCNPNFPKNGTQNYIAEHRYRKQLQIQTATSTPQQHRCCGQNN
ncbi:MAG: radical SAM protein [Planctomycetaceae bacterium]|jgi:organic radical activating enzyme|nr:radical SAM protein [Planctomycetaceae bacterium]